MRPQLRRDCPARTSVQHEGQDLSVQCQRPVTDTRPPWHQGLHRAEYAPPLDVLGWDGRVERQEARVVSWY